MLIFDHVYTIQISIYYTNDHVYTIQINIYLYIYTVYKYILFLYIIYIHNFVYIFIINIIKNIMILNSSKLKHLGIKKKEQFVQS